MSITIKSIYGHALYVAQNAADVRAAVIEAASKKANLSWANLTGANLTGAYLTGANLTGAKGFDPRRCNSLLMLLDQPGAIRAYKLVTDTYQSPMGYGPLTYTIGTTLEAPDADTDATQDCGAGINVATLPWVMSNWQTTWRIVVVEFTAADIAAIPVGEGKFRVRRCTVIRELDLVELGLVPGSR